MSTTLFPVIGCGFINPRIRTFIEKRFHGLFSKKKRSKSGGVPSFPRREHVLAENSLPSGQPTALDQYHKITYYLKSSDIFCPRKLFWAKIPLPKKTLQKNRSIFGLKNQSCYRRKNSWLLLFQGFIRSVQVP